MPIDPDDPKPQLQTQPQPSTPPERQSRKPAPPPKKLPETAQWPHRPPRPEVLLETVRKLAKRRRISFMDHAEFRFETRFVEIGFDMFDLLRALERGYVSGSIEAGKKEGEWKAKIVDVPEGTSRKMGVVTIVVREQRLLIKTVEWEDR